MKTSYLREVKERGTTSFPIGSYYVDKTHPHYHMQAQWHSDLEINLVIQGTLTMQVGGRTYELGPDQAIFIPSDMVHAATPHNCIYECIVFPPKILYATPKNQELLLHRLNQPVLFDQNPEIIKLFKKIKEKPAHYEFLVLSILYRILFEVFEKQNNSSITTKALDTDRIKPTLSYIEEHYEQNITLPELAESCFLSPNYFCALFKRATGYSPMEYITRYRIQIACEMLIARNSVTNTAYACGFNHPSYFISTFKKYIGISPKQYALKSLLNDK